MPVLYLNGYETEARLDHNKVEVTRINHEKDDLDTLSVPFFDIERVVVTGRAQLSTPLIQRLAREGIPICFLSGGGRWLGSLYPTAGNHALRRVRQYEIARDDALALSIAKKLVASKLMNSRRVLQRLSASRDQSETAEQLSAANSLLKTARDAEQATGMDELRGYEGVGAAVYFKRLSAFFPEDIPFTVRSRRPPRDAANALLSWTYTILLGEIDGAVQAAGLDPCLGFLHDISYGRPSLSLDLLESLRAPVCDMLTLRLLNHNILKAADFEYQAEDGGTYLTRDARKSFFVEYERTMTRRFSPAKNEAHTDFRGVLREQVNALLRLLENRGDGEFFRMP